MSKPHNLNELLIEEIQDLYSAESQLIKALPKMAEAATDPGLQNGFNEHWEQTKEHARRLEEAAEYLGAKAKGKTCKAMKGLIAEGSELAKFPEGGVRDAALIAAAQKVEHYEIAGYGTVRTFAELLGQNAVAKILNTTLQEEADTDKKLTSLAKRINLEAEFADEGEND